MQILTFDIEEWFHILDNASTKTENEWGNYDSRICNNVEKILSALEQTDTKATFFCLGWVAEKYPHIIKKIVANGYELGSHSYMHQLIYEQDKDSFESDLESSIKRIEDVSGAKVKYFRAPGFSIRAENMWAFEIISRLGIEVDCSVFPAHRAHGGLPSYKESRPAIIKYNDISLKELPINYLKLLGFPIIYSGGGYFRLFPYQLIKYWTKKSHYLMSYLHPRDFDPDQPVIEELSMQRRIKSYIGLNRAEKKLLNWLSDFDFIDVGTAVKRIDWDKAPIVELSV